MPNRRVVYMAFVAFTTLCFLSFYRFSDQPLQTPSRTETPLRTAPNLAGDTFISPESGVRQLEPTNLLIRPHGFTISDNLYLRNGTLYAIVEDPSTWPELKFVLAKGLSSDLGIDLDPTDKEMQIITPFQAKRILGDNAIVIDGMSFIMYDSTQFMIHYYHWWGEIMLGAMRVYSALALIPNMLLPLPEPKRFIIPNVRDHSWRDYAGVDGPMMRAAFPSCAIARGDYWDDLTKLERTFVFERAMIVSRTAAHLHPLASQWFKMISSTMSIEAPKHFWEPIRQRLVTNYLAHLPLGPDGQHVPSPGDSRGAMRIGGTWLPSLDDMVKPRRETSPEGTLWDILRKRQKSDSNSDASGDDIMDSSIPLVLYISRQGGGRRLTNEAHESLLEAMDALCDRRVGGKRFCYFIVAQMENWAIRDQIDAAARATVMLGVHGNGLTHQLWMPPSSRSTVIEIFYPKNYIHDYEMLARNMGHKHYGVWNDTTVTFPEGQYFPGVEYGEQSDFNGDHYPVHGPTVAEVVRKRIVGEK